MKCSALAALLSPAVLLFAAPALAQAPVQVSKPAPDNMPNMSRVKREGVDFANSHSLYPTVTTVNASAIATGHYIGDTGDFGNTIYVGSPMISLKDVPLGFLEN